MKTRKLLAVVLAVAMLVSLFVVPVLAEGEGVIVEDLGILLGDGDGVTEAYLAKTATKLQGAMAALRLRGLDADALAFEGTDTFTDAAEATAYWAPVLAYYKANPALGFQGPGDGSFGVEDTLTAQMFNKVLLVVLGYEEGVDFTWDTVNEFAESVGLTALAGKTDLTNMDIAVAIVEALGLETVGGMTLISTLVADGVIEEAAAVAAGFEVEEEALAIEDAYATATNEITAVLNIAIPEDATVTLKKGAVGLNTTMATSDDGMTLTFTGFFDFSAGTYTLTVNDATFTFAVEAETAVDLQLGADYVYIGADQDLEVGLLNQYNDPMSLTGVTASVTNVTEGTSLIPTLTTTAKIDTTGIDAEDELFVFVYDPASMLSVQGTVVVKANPVLKGITLGDVTLGDDDASALYVSEAGNELAVSAVDQYGNTYKLTTADLADLTIISSATGTITTPLTVNSDGDLVFTTGATAGTATITVIITTEGVIAQSAPIVVLADPVLTVVEVTGATEAVYVDEETELAAAGFDQYGDTAALSSAVTFTSTNTGILPTMSGAKVMLTPTVKGTATVFYYLNGVLVDSFSVTVNAEAIPTLITAVDVTDAVQTGVEVDITSGSATVVDQYGREIDIALSTLDNEWDINMTWAGANNFTVTSDGAQTFTLDSDSMPVGTDTFNILLTKDGVDVASTVMAFTVENIAASAITTIEMSEVPTMYSGVNKELLVTPASVYNETVTFTGKTEDDKTVTLVSTAGVPNILDTVTTSTANLTLVGNVLTASGTVDETVVVKAWRDGEITDSIEVTLAKADPVVTELYYTKNNLSAMDMFNTSLHLDYLVGSNLTVKDQYGKDLNLELVLGAPLTLEEKIVGNAYQVMVERENGYQIWTYTPTTGNLLEADTIYTESFVIIIKDGSLSAEAVSTDWPLMPVFEDDYVISGS